MLQWSIGRIAAQRVGVLSRAMQDSALPTPAIQVVARTNLYAAPASYELQELAHGRDAKLDSLGAAEVVGAGQAVSSR